MIRGTKLREMLKSENAAGRGNKGFRQRFRESLGLSRKANGQPTVKPGHLSHQEFSLQEVAFTFLGHGFRDRLREVGPVTRLREAGGYVTPSTFSDINAFTDVVGGLLERAVLEGYEQPDYIGKMLVRMYDNVRVNGGKMVRYANDNLPVEDDLPWGDPYPNTGLRPDFIEIPDNKRKGKVLQVTEAVFLYDHTDSVMDAASNHGLGVARDIEIEIADTVLGIVNTYNRKGSASNTYLTSAGASPNDYVNAVQSHDLVNATDLDEARQTLAGNTDPDTGYSIIVNKPQSRLLVMRGRAFTARTLVTAGTIERRTASEAEIAVGPNPFAPTEVIEANEEWVRRLVDISGLSAANAGARWKYGNFQKAFGWRSVVPFESRTLPAGVEEARRDIVLTQLTREVGTCFVIEPRYVYKGGADAF